MSIIFSLINTFMASIYNIPYNGQIREYISQFMRIFTGIMVEYDGHDYDNDGLPDKRQVKVVYAAMDRVVADILHTDGTFTATSLPLISGYLTSINRDDERRKAPTHVDRRAYVDENNQIKSLERLIPIPYRASMQVSIYSDNTNMKFQILEKILSIFNPDLTFHKNNDSKDWTNIVRAEFVGISDESNQPVGTDGRTIIDTLDFEFDFWLGFPMKEGNSAVVKSIIANITDTTQEIAGIDTLTIV